RVRVPPGRRHIRRCRAADDARRIAVGSSRHGCAGAVRRLRSRRASNGCARLVAGSLGAWVALIVLAGRHPSPDSSYRRVIQHRAVRRPGLSAYLERRLGRGLSTMLRNWFMRSFGAGTFSEFWQYWNPVYGYFLAYYIYALLRRICPRPMAVWLTFLTCGFVMHALPGR